MEQKTVSPPEPARFAQLAEEFRQASDAPIYDGVEREWLAEGREVPRRPGAVVGQPVRGERPMTCSGVPEALPLTAAGTAAPAGTEGP